MYKTAWRIGCEQLNSALRHPRVWLTVLLSVGIVAHIAMQLQKVANLSDQPLQIVESAFASLNNTNYTTLLFFCALILFVDIPYGNGRDLFVLIRAGRSTWMLGKILYLFMITILYVLVLSIAAILMVAKNAYIGNIWSYPFYRLIANGTGNQLLFPIMMDAAVMEAFTPFSAYLSSLGLFTLYLLTCGLVICLCNMGRSRVLGFGVVGGLHALGYIARQSVAVHILPFNHTSLGYLQTDTFWGSRYYCGFGESWIYFAVVIVFLCIAIQYRVGYTDLFRMTGEE